MEGRSILVAGYSRLPAQSPAQEVLKVLSVALEVNPETGIVLDAECGLISHVAKRIARDCIVGFSLPDELEMIIDSIERRYHGAAQRALIMAVREAAKKFCEVRGRQGRNGVRTVSQSG